MTSVRTVSEIKRNKKNHHKSDDGMPRLGTRLRTMYEELRTGRIVVASKEFGPNANGMLRQLRDFYGMEIETSVNGSRLVGEWDGPYYVPVERTLSL